MYTLGTASKAVGKSKSTVLSAINSGKISASKDDHGQWQIDPAELHRLYAPTRSEEHPTERNEAPCRQGGEHGSESFASELKERIAVLERTLDDARADRDEWRAEARAWQAQAEDLKAMAMQLQQQLALPPGEEAGQRPRGFWTRMFRRK